MDTRSEPSKEEHTTLATKFKEERDPTSKKATIEEKTEKVFSKVKALMFLRLNVIAAIKWDTLQRTVSSKRKTQRGESIMPQQHRMMSQRRSRRALLVRRREERSFIWYQRYPT